MNMEQLRVFAKEKHQKSKGNFAFGFLCAILSILLVIGAAVLSLLKKDGTTVAYTIKTLLIGRLRKFTFYAFAVLVVLTFVTVVLTATKMFAKKAKNSGNFAFFWFPALAAILFISAYEVKTILVFDLVYFNYSIYALLGALGVCVFYNIVMTFANAKVWKANNGKSVLIGFLALIVNVCAIVLFYLFAMPVLGLADYDALYKAYSAIYIPDIMKMISIMGVKDIPIILANICNLAIFAVVGVVLLCTLLSIVRLFLNANYVRGSRYFFASSPIFALVLVFLPVLMAICVAFNGLRFGAGFSLPNDTIKFIIAFIVVLAVYLLYIIALCSDKKRAKAVVLDTAKNQEKEELGEIVLDKSNVVIEEPVEEGILNVVAEEEKVEPEIPVVEEVVPEIVEEEKVETIEEVEETEEVESEIPVFEETPLYDNAEFVQEKFQEEPIKEEKEPEQPVNNGAFNNQFIPQGYYPPTPYGIPIYNANNQIIGYAPYPGQPAQPMYGQPMYGQPVQPVYGQPVQPMYAQPVQPMYGQPVQPMYGQPAQPMYGQPMYGQPVQPMYNQQQPQPQQSEPVVEEEENSPLSIPKKTLEEKVAELTTQEKNYYKQILAYANAKNGTKHTKGVYADSIYYGRDLIVKVQVKQGKILCQFQLVDFKVKEMLKSREFSAKHEQTVVKVKDKNSLDAAKRSIDMAYNLALEAKEARHQEQLKKRREARAAKK